MNLRIVITLAVVAVAASMFCGPTNGPKPPAEPTDYGVRGGASNVVTTPPSGPCVLHGDVMGGHAKDGRLTLLVRTKEHGLMMIDTAPGASIVSLFPRREHTPETVCAYLEVRRFVKVMVGVRDHLATDVIMVEDGDEE